MLRELASQINIFKYITFRASYAAVTALVLSLILGPAVIRWLKKKKYGQEVRDDGPETHFVKAGTPTMGGIIMLTTIIIITITVVLYCLRKKGVICKKPPVYNFEMHEVLFQTDPPKIFYDYFTIILHENNFNNEFVFLNHSTSAVNCIFQRRF